MGDTVRGQESVHLEELNPSNIDCTSSSKERGRFSGRARKGVEQGTRPHRAGPLRWSRTQSHSSSPTGSITMPP